MGKTYASSDWHGCGVVGLKALDFLQKDDRLIFLGDAIDRGPNGVELMLKLLTDPRVTYLKGNHEHFLEDCAEKILNDYGYGAGELWLFGNGGMVTWESLTKKLTKKQILNLVKQVKALPVQTLYFSEEKNHTVLLEHAGYSPFYANAFKADKHDPLWDRDHFMYPWTDEKANVSPDRAKEINNTYLVHGHTPVQYLKYHYRYFNTTENPSKPQLTLEDMAEKRAFFNGEKADIKPKVLQYCDGHKFDIDMCTIVSDRIALLDLDTFETVYID